MEKIMPDTTFWEEARGAWAERVIIALTSIASGQVNVDAGLKALQKDVGDILEKAGAKIRKG